MENWRPLLLLVHFNLEYLAEKLMELSSAGESGAIVQFICLHSELRPLQPTCKQIVYFCNYANFAHIHNLHIFTSKVRMSNFNLNIQHWLWPAWDITHLGHGVNPTVWVLIWEEADMPVYMVHLKGKICEGVSVLTKMGSDTYICT